METLLVPWLIVGFAGQLIFVARFAVQWIYSELRGRSVVPHLFWYFSIVGGVMLLAYAIHKRDPVFIIGQSGGLIVYLRNLQWRIGEARQAAQSKH